MIRQPPISKERPLSYCPFTGKFHRKFKAGWRETFLTKDNDGYLNGKIKGKVVGAHIVAMKLMGSYVVGLEVDHINHVRDDNRFVNLRHLTHLENSKHRKNFDIQKLPSGNYRARCSGIHLGTYEDYLFAKSAILLYLNN